MISTGSGVYMIVDNVSGRRYVGSAVNLRKRRREHWRGLESGKHHSKFMRRCWAVRPDAFEFKVVLYCSRENLLMYEQLLIDGYKPEFNSAPKAGSQLGFRMSDESKAKLSEAAKRTKNFTGHKHSEESRKKISDSRKGKGGDKGWTQERRDRISAALKGRVISDDQRAKISAKLTGSKQSPETIAKRAEKLRGRKMPPGFAEATTARLRGVKLSAEHCVAVGKAKASLTDDQVRSIRSRLESGERQKPIALDYGVDSSVISEIKNRRSYRWVD